MLLIYGLKIFNVTVLTLNYPCPQCLLDNGDMIKAEKTEKRALSVDEFTLKLELFVCCHNP